MKEMESPFTCFQHYVMRTPLLPAARILDVQNKDLDVFFRGMFGNPVFKEAIFLASPALFDSYRKWYQGDLEEPKKITRLFYSLLKYYLRMSTRCTPFGLFAGCSTGTSGEGSSVILEGEECYHRHIRLDMNYLIALMIRVSGEPSLRSTLNYHVNSSIYITLDKARFVEYEYINKRRIHNLVSIDYNEYLEAIFEKCRSGCKVNELIDLLVQMDIPADEAAEYINDLIASQVLISEIEPGVSGKECDKEFIDLLQRIRAGAADQAAIACLSEWIDFLEDILHDMNRLDRQGLGNQPEDYMTIVEKIRTRGTPFDAEFLFQAELNKPSFNAQLDKSIFADLLEGIRVLASLTEKPPRSHLEKFVDAFHERYEDREVSLVEALDTDIGIGYRSDSVHRLDYNPFFSNFEAVYPKGEQIPEIKWTKQKSFWTRKLLDAHMRQEDEILITETDLPDIGSPPGMMPATFSMMASLHCPADGDGITEIHIHQCGGTGAASLLGRFCYNDTAIHDIAREIIAYEDELGSGRVFSEIVHLPESRVGNILSRPALRAFEIPYLAKSCLAPEKQIKIDDLYISVKNRRLVLRSRRLNKEIEPRLSTAHNFEANSLPVYNFLCDLQCQGKRPAIFLNFGVIQDHLNFIPRIRYKNLILSPRTWFLNKADWKGFQDAPPDELLRLFAELRSRLRLPQFIAIVEADNHLILNLGDRNCIRLFADEVKDKEKVSIIEIMLPGENALVRDVNGNKFANQFIFSIKSPRPATHAKTIQPDQEALPAQKRTFIAGDEWLYLKIYVSNRSANRILRECIAPVVTGMTNDGLIRRWFFIRFTDPHPHIRLRFLATDRQRIPEILGQCNEVLHPWVDAGIIWKVQLDTYSRELERYGFDNIELTEEIFHHDSEACLRLISMIDNESLTRDSWLIALKSIDGYLTNWQLDGPEKHKYVLDLRNGFANEYDYSDKLRKMVDKIYREKGKTIDAFLDGTGVADAAISPILMQRESAIASIYKKMESASGKEQCMNLLFSYMHMSLNRMFSSKQRQQEFIMYCMLEKYYFVASKKAAILKLTT